MILARHTRSLPSVIRLPLVCLLVVAQVLLAFAPVSEGRFGPDARPHVEAGGTAAHHAHDASHCAACVARGLLSTTEISSRVAVDPEPARAFARAFRETRFDSLRESTSRPRAPPLRLA
ncbi:MAG TPA: hypothetical protein VM166_07230 [Gemmatimonadaceae bacterium]|nr:hypothetical protein [Gemmatimonadaceae bacterium]